MNIEVKNLGVINSGSISTSGSMTILCGPNSTGKTYLSYLLYYLFSDNSYVELDCYKDFWATKGAGNSVEFVYSKQILDDFLDAEATKAKSELGLVFGLASEDVERLFGDLEINLSLSKADYEDNKSRKASINAYNNKFIFKIILNDEPGKIRIEKLDSNPIPESEEYKIWNFMICQSIRRAAYLPGYKPWMLIVERNSIYSFRNELINYSGFEDFGFAGDDLVRVVEFGPRRYPLAIRRSLKYANDLENIKLQQSPYYTFAVELEERLLHGNIESNQNGEIEFVIDNENRVRRLPIHLTSSIVKTMASLILHLKYSAGPNDIIIIDEPEINLHPDNQIILARIFGELVNKGLRLVISTHSDYIVRELNNMMMAYELNALDNMSYREFGLTDNMLLNKEDVNVYYFDVNNRQIVVNPAEIDRYGFRVDSIDNAIISQNDATDTLHDILKYDYPIR